MPMLKLIHFLFAITIFPSRLIEFALTYLFYSLKILLSTLLRKMSVVSPDIASLLNAMSLNTKTEKNPEADNMMVSSIQSNPALLKELTATLAAMVRLFQQQHTEVSFFIMSR